MTTMESPAPQRGRGILRTLSLVFAAVFVIGVLFRLTEAGSLTPSVLPAATMKTLEDIFNPLAGTYDSSDVPALRNGNVLNEMKCIIGRLKGFDECAFDFAKSPSPICVAGLSVNYAATQLASFSWSQMHTGAISKTVAVSEYHFTLSPSVFASSQYSDFEINLGCAYEGVNLASISMCNGSACDYCVTTVTVNDPLTVCP